MSINLNPAGAHGQRHVSGRWAEKGPKRAAIFARTASSNQRDLSNIEAQVFSCRKYAEEIGVEVARIYKHVGVSGVGRSRLDLEELLRDAAAGTFNVLIVEDVDRLGRDTARVYEVACELEDRFITICTVGRGQVTALDAAVVVGSAAAQVAARAAIQAARGQRKFKNRRNLPPLAGGDGG